VQAALPELGRRLLVRLKHVGHATTAELAVHAGVSYEAARTQLAALESDGFVTHRSERGARGRPARRYSLTPAGDNRFAKRYDELAVELVDAAAGVLGPEALAELLAHLTDERVARWETRLQGLTLNERLEALRDVYLDDDPFTVVETDTGGPRLIERNCPYLNVASRRPAICSVTVSTLARLLGVKVIRDERFQAGDGRCAFRVLSGQHIDAAFRFGWEPDVAHADAGPG
jgi:predicted ArsR family transcriptional regulator